MEGKKGRSPELKSVFHECVPGRRELAVKAVDIFGNDTTTIVIFNPVGFDGFELWRTRHDLNGNN